MILTSYFDVGVHYKKNNGVSSKLAPVSIVTLWIQVVMTDCFQQQSVITTCIHSVEMLFTRNSIILVVMHTDMKVACEDHMSSLMMASKHERAFD
jgi:hypothetical protein